MLPEIDEIGIPGQPLEIAITEIQRAFQGADRLVKLLGQRIASGEIVVHERILGAQLGELHVHPQAFLDLSAAGIIVPQNLQRFDKGRIASDDSLDESDFDVQISPFGAAQFFSLTDFLRHTTLLHDGILRWAVKRVANFDTP